MLSVIKILRELNLGTLVDRFDAEKIDPYNVISASDRELTRLGVSTIGDRIRLRDLCSRAVERAVPSEQIWKFPPFQHQEIEKSD